MKICVQGLWHLGAVTAACLASVGHDVIGLDPDRKTVEDLRQGKAPLFEPGLNELLRSGLDNGRLHFSFSAEDAAAAEVLWVAFDTPVDDDDQADVESVLSQIKSLLPTLADGALVLVSSQMPVGSVRLLENFAAVNLPGKSLGFACSPENLRLGKALELFLKPDRVVAGVRCGEAKQKLEKLLLPITDRIEWMSVESAEMTKHAINAFLALSVTFANEIASICELVGADAKEVERGLKTEMRIGPKAYLAPGGPFAGGTLARDVAFLVGASKERGLRSPLLSSVSASNDAHKHWVQRKLLERFATLDGITIAVWGLTYKPGTDTLRRSLAVELCDWLLEQGARVSVHDPVVQHLPQHWAGHVVRHPRALGAVEQAAALIVGTEWPQFRKEAEGLAGVANPDLLVIDPNRYLQTELSNRWLKYVAVGTPAARGD